MTTLKVSVDFSGRAQEGSIENELNAKTPKDIKKYLLAKYIKEKIQTARLRSNEFAGRVNKRPSEITKWLSGNHNFTIETLFEIEEHLGITIINLSEPPKKSDVSVKCIGVTVSNVKLNVPKYKPLLDRADFFIKEGVVKSFQTDLLVTEKY